jgi:hypothetical protein
MQHLKRRNKRNIEVQDSRTKEAQGNNEEIHELDSQLAHWWRTELSGGTQCSLRREAHNGRSRAIAPDCPMCTKQSR